MESLKGKAKTRKEVALGYGTTVKTLLRRLAKMNIFLEPGLIFPKILMLIEKALGNPSKLKNVLFLPIFTRFFLLLCPTDYRN
jgi:hypothetical protein